MPKIILDANGTKRRCGTLPMPKGRVSALPPFTGLNQPSFTLEQIKEIITDPSRVRKRELFDEKWILNQLSFGSCNGHGLASAGARARYLGGRRDGLLFSGSFSYAWMKRDGTDPGSIIGDDVENCQTNGLLPLSRGPANKINRRDYTAEDIAEAKRHLGLEAYKFVGTFAQKMLAMQTALALNWPCIVAVMAGPGYSRVDSDGVAVGVDRGIGNHAVCNDDIRWNDAKKRIEYDSPGSWGTSLGQDGRVWLHDGHFQQTAGSHEFVCVPAVDFKG